MTKAIKDIIQTIIPPKLRWKIKLFHHWKNIIGPMHEHVSLQQIKDNYIILGVSHPAWAQELHVLSPMLKKKVNTLLNEQKIKKIHFRIITKSKNPNNNNNVKTKKSPHTSEPPTLLARESKALTALEDEDLRILLKRFLIRCKKQKGRT